MKIIDSRKDFYDYVVGQFGIDKDVVLDRRKYDTIEYYLKKNPDSPLRWFFNDMPSPNINDSYPQIYDGRYRWQFPFFVDYKKFIGKPLGSVGCLVVELGFRRWIFCVERYKSYESGKIVINVIGIIDCNISVNDKILPNPILLYQPYMLTEASYNKRLAVNYYYNNKKAAEEHTYTDLILKDTFIPKHISPQDAYYALYNYQLAMREPQVIDNRTDLQKIDSYGFDRKTSFRKM